MRISLEVFGIPEGAAAGMRRSVYDSYERFLHRHGPHGPSLTLGVKGGTCPLTGRSYLHVLVEAPHPVDLEALRHFADAVYAAHPLKDDEIVRSNRSVRIEDSCREGAPLEGLDENDIRDDGLSCWICSRFDGEEYYDHERGATATLEVRLGDPGRVPLCGVCLRLLQDRRLIE